MASNAYNYPAATLWEVPTDRMAHRLGPSLQDRYALFDAFMQEAETMKNQPKPCPPITPPHVGAGRLCARRVPVPLPPTVFECPEEDECDYLDEAESTTACDDGSPVCAGPFDKPLPPIPRSEKALPPTPIRRDKALPPLPHRGRRVPVKIGKHDSPSCGDSKKTHGK
ncbi:hypothetical protein C8Q77DRAFT_1152208 [Trametes polyzona]|nr:hypothetical protein C8Q77DRAFT_1152208 [Trametes polyzona]